MKIILLLSEPKACCVLTSEGTGGADSSRQLVLIQRVCHTYADINCFHARNLSREQLELPSFSTY